MHPENESEHDNDLKNGKSRPAPEPLTPEEKEAFLARVRARAETLTPEEREAIFGGQTRSPTRKAAAEPEAEWMQEAPLDDETLAKLEENFFPELGDPHALPAQRLLHGIIFDFDYTLAYRTRPLDELMAEGAQAAERYMRSTGMNDLPDDFWPNIVEARRFAEEKSEEEREEHIADDALSFLLQFFGYPASKMDPNVLRTAVDLFYAPEMTAWRLYPGVQDALQTLHAEGFKLAVIANYNLDRAFQRTIDYLGIRPYLDLCISSAAVEFRKPDPKIFNIALERWDALPYEVAVVGDSLLHDVQGGLEVGTLTLWARFGSPPQVEHDNDQLRDQVRADATFDDYARLPDQIRQWANP
jgi:FMN phosphatase YigB (HAD superfamily)